MEQGEIRFTVKLSKKAVKAFAAQGADTGDEIKELMVEQLREFIDQTKEECADTDDDDED